jgi:hypothetical protein
MRFPLLLLAGILATFIGPNAAFAGSFSGDFTFRWLNEPAGRHRVMQSLQEVSFTDDAGKRWRVPRGTKIDGASIPPGLWSFAGSPFTGNYRRASVIHDFFCDTQTELRSAIHLMFRNAMATDGITGVELFSKYTAVRLFGNNCGRPDNLFALLFESGPMEGFVATPELKSNLENYSATKELGSVSDRIETVAAIAQVSNPRSFEAMAEFRRIPSEANYERLQNAISAEQPSESETDALIVLTLATVPEGSAELPTSRE